MNKTVFFNFVTKETINPLETIKEFYVSPYDCYLQTQLNLTKRLEEIQVEGGSIGTMPTTSGHVVTLFPIEKLFTDPEHCMITWRDDAESFIIRTKKGRKIYCKIVDPTIICVTTVC